MDGCDCLGGVHTAGTTENARVNRVNNTIVSRCGVGYRDDSPLCSECDTPMYARISGSCARCECALHVHTMALPARHGACSSQQIDVRITPLNRSPSLKQLYFVGALFIAMAIFYLNGLICETFQSFEIIFLCPR
jgi:hypothetical protein